MKKCAVFKNKLFAIEKILQYFNKKLFVIGKKLFVTELKNFTIEKNLRY